MTLEHKAPAGYTRVVSIDPLDRADYFVGDYDNPKEAFLVADKHNARRRNTGDNVFCVYNDAGERLRDERAIAVGPGVIPH